MYRMVSSTEIEFERFIIVQKLLCIIVIAKISELAQFLYTKYEDYEIISD